MPEHQGSFFSVVIDVNGILKVVQHVGIGDADASTQPFTLGTLGLQVVLPKVTLAGTLGVAGQRF